MQERSTYLSEFFMDTVWVGYERTLKRKKTRDNYFTAVCSLCEYAKKEFTDISVAQAVAYFHMRQTAEPEPAKKTMHTWLSAYRGLGRYIEDNCKDIPEYKSYRSPFEKIYLDEYTDNIHAANLPTEKELEQIVQTAKDMDDDGQMYLIMLLATKCAMTAGEIRSLTPQRIQQDAAGRGFVVFRENQGETRIVKLPNVIMEYLRENQDTYKDRETLFLNKSGTPLSERSLQIYVKKLVERAGIQHPVTLQDIRNLTIAKMLLHGATEEETAAYVGIETRWMYRYSKILPELDFAPCDRI